MPFSAQTLKAARLHLMKSEPTMRSIIKTVGPCKIKSNRDRFVALASSIVGQQISRAAARTVWERLEDAVAPLKVSFESLERFDIESMRQVGVSRQKATYLLDLAKTCRNGQIEFDKFPKMNDEEVIERLTQVKGIGLWTAQMFLMFSLCRTDVFPLGDLGIQSSIKQNYNLHKTPDSKKMLEIGLPWQPFSTIASWYLWRSYEIHKNAS